MEIRVKLYLGTTTFAFLLLTLIGWSLIIKALVFSFDMHSVSKWEIFGRSVIVGCLCVFFHFWWKKKNRAGKNREHIQFFVKVHITCWVQFWNWSECWSSLLRVFLKRIWPKKRFDTAKHWKNKNTCNTVSGWFFDFTADDPAPRGSFDGNRPWTGPSF